MVAAKGGIGSEKNAPAWLTVLQCLATRQRELAVLVVVLMFLLSGMQQNTSSSMYQDLDKEILKSRLRQEEPNRIVGWRNQSVAKCQIVSNRMKTRWDKWARRKKREVEDFAVSKIAAPDPSAVSDQLLVTHQPYVACKNAFIDLGTNIGDTIGYFIDNAMDVCTPIWMQANPKVEFWLRTFPRPRINVTTLEFLTQGQQMNNALYWLGGTLRDWEVNPEDMCVYGMEGNPLFTKRLQKLENFLWQTNPRFFKHLHIHTEHVIAKTNGPALLFLDQVSTEYNFWGSSILDSLTDAKQTAAMHGGKAVAANVTGINLSTLLRRTMSFFREDVSEEDKTGGKLVIKMDVEGAEYQVLKEASNSGALCDFAKAGNQVKMLVEFHTEEVIENQTDFAHQKAGIKRAMSALRECGVVFEGMRGTWV